MRIRAAEKLEEASTSRFLFVRAEGDARGNDLKWGRCSKFEYHIGTADFQGTALESRAPEGTEEGRGCSMPANSGARRGSPIPSCLGVSWVRK